MAPRTARRCPHCDAAIDPSATFCDQCGNTLPATGSTQILPTPQPSARRSSPLLWVVTVVVIGVVIGLIGVVWSRVSQPAAVVMLVTSSVPAAIPTAAAVVSISTPSVPSPVPATTVPIVSACLVPDVIGQDQGTAEGLIAGTGLQPVKSTAYDTSIPAGRIISQEPSSGTKMSPCKGDIAITVSLGNAPINSTIVPVSTQSLTENLLFEDDFEDVLDGAYPSKTGWYIRFDGSNAYITTKEAFSGRKSFFLAGRDHYARRDIINMSPINYIQYEAWIKVAGANMQCGVGFNNVSKGEWGTDYAFVTFKSDGSIFADGLSLQTYRVGQWYHIRVVADFVKEKMNVYIDEILRGQNLSTGSKEWTNFSLTSDWNSAAYFDNVRIVNLNREPDLNK